MINFDFAVLSGLLHNVKKATRNNVSCQCAFCGKDDHMFVNTKTFLFDCKKCKIEGNLFALLKQLGSLHLLKGELIILENPIRKLSLAGPDAVEEEIDLDDNQKAKLPIGFKPLSLDKPNKFLDYLLKRKFTDIDFELYQPGFTRIITKYDGYVIVPITKNFETKAFIGRYIGNADADGRLRYQNSLSEFAKLMFGFDEITSGTRKLIIVEGIFDKTSVTTELNLHYQDEWKCCATFGNKISKFQMLLLKYGTNIDTIYIMYDGKDSVNVMKKYAAELSQYFDVKVCYIKDNDPGDSNQDQILSALEAARSPVEFHYGRIHRRKFL